jgi:hypothetical protein
MEDQEGSAPEEVAEGAGEEAVGSGQSSTVDDAMTQIPGLAESLQTQSAARQAGNVDAGAGEGSGEPPPGDEAMDDSVDEAIEEIPGLEEQDLS